MNSTRKERLTTEIGGKKTIKDGLFDAGSALDWRQIAERSFF